MELWDHQKKAIETYKDMSKYGLFFDVGTGKTATAIGMMRQKYLKHSTLLRTLILCPPIVINNWKKEIMMWTNVKDRDIHELRGPVPQRIEVVTDLIQKQKTGIIITNYEALINEKFHQVLLGFRAQVIIADESHKIKNPGAKRTKRCFTLGDSVPYRIIMSGSPILRNAMDLWSQFRFLDSGDSFGASFYEFRSKYFYDKNATARHIKFPDWRPRKEMEAKVTEKIDRLSMRIRKDECLDLPPLVKKVQEVDLSNEQAKMYDEMKKDFIAYMGGEVVVAQNALTKALRLQQIVSGHIPMEALETGDKKLRYFRKTPRDDALRDILEQVAFEHKVIIWAVFRANYETIRKICKELKLGYVEIHGEVTDKARDKGVHRYNNDPDVRVCIGHPGSGGIGINLVDKLSTQSYSIFYSRNFSLEFDIQAEARNYRGGSERYEKVTRIDLVAKDTIDEHIMSCLRQKKVISASILQDIVEEI